VLEISHLDSGLDDVERSRYNQRGGSTTDRSNEVLVPGSGVVVLKLEDELLSSGGTSEEGERARSISGSSPLPSTVETEALVGNNLEETTALESLWVRLTLDLEHVQWEEDNLSDTDQGTGSSGHDGLSGTFAECVLESSGMVVGEVVTGERLSTILVNTLENLVAGSVTKTGEEREELLSERSGGIVLEDDGVELGDVVNLELRPSVTRFTRGIEVYRFDEGRNGR
jgi:hypothetical protein